MGSQKFKKIKNGINQIGIKKHVRVAEDIKSNAKNQAAKQNLDDFLAYYVNTTEDIEILLECVAYIKQKRYVYLREKVRAPHNIENNNKNVKKLNLDPDNEEVDYYFVQEYFPLESYVKKIKADILYECEKKLFVHGYGKNKIKDIITYLTEILTFDECNKKLKDKGYKKKKIDLILYRLAKKLKVIDELKSKKTFLDTI